MVDNCSTTARLGSRKWAPRFDYIFDQVTPPPAPPCPLPLSTLLPSSHPRHRTRSIQIAYPALDANKPADPKQIEAFKANSVHKAVTECCKLRPSVDISLFAESTMLERER